jgi:hypothetical protein
MVPMVDLGPTDPDDSRAVAARGKRTIERTYLYHQPQRSFAEAVFKRKRRNPTYVVRVAEDHRDGHIVRRLARTERYDPERGSASCTGHGTPERVDILRLPGKIAGPMAVFAVAVFIILMVVLPFPLSMIAGVYWTWSLMWRMAYAVERKRFAEYLRTRPETPPLLSDEELEARVLKLANPDEDRTFDDPAPIPMTKSLRDRAWQRWEERLPELADQEYRVGRMTYTVKQNNGFSDGPGHPLYQLVEEVRLGTAFCASYRDVAYIRDGSGKTVRKVTEIDGEDHETLRPLFEALGREVLGPVALRELDDRRRAAAHGEPMLDRWFAARTDCADGHVGDHPILSTFIDSNGNKRVRRGCPWCPSVWSELV